MRKLIQSLVLTLTLGASLYTGMAHAGADPAHPTITGVTTYFVPPTQTCTGGPEPTCTRSGSGYYAYRFYVTINVPGPAPIHVESNDYRIEWGHATFGATTWKYYYWNSGIPACYGAHTPNSFAVVDDSLGNPSPRVAVAVCATL
jgi:hypothetical protein